MKTIVKHTKAKQPAKNQDEPFKMPPLADGSPYVPADPDAPGIGEPPVNQDEPSETECGDRHHYQGSAPQFVEHAMNGAERVYGCVRGLLSRSFREKCKAAVEANWPSLRKSAARRQFEELKPLKSEPLSTKLHREQVFMFFDMVETAEHAK